MSVFPRLTALVLFCVAGATLAQDDADVVAIADEALLRISADDSAGLAALMIPEAMVYVGVQDPDGTYRTVTRTYADTRTRPIESDLEERGWDPTVLVSGTIAVVWYPYDIYVDGEWSHCGIDIFNMIRTNAGWRIAVLQYNVQQPPECSPHPDGPPDFSN
jgi:hypothetical protein